MFVIVMRWIVIVIWWSIMRWTRYALALDDYTMALPQPNDPLHTHVYEVRPRKDRRGFDLISDVLPFGRLWYDEPNAARNAIGYASQYSAGHMVL